MKTIKQLLVLLLALSGQGCLAVDTNQPAKFSVRVLNERTGQPVEGITIGAGFDVGRWPEERGVRVNRTTSSNGVAIFQHETSGTVGFSIRQPGYYDHVTPTLPLTRGTTRWEPWNATNEVLLKPIIKPADLKQLEFASPVPELGQPVGFDLDLGDWTPPHGKGVRADLFVTMTRELRPNEEFTLNWSVQFPHPLDGMIPFNAPLSTGSELRWNHLAPESGYLTNKTWLRERRDARHDNPKGIVIGWSEEQHYYLRFRTVTDDTGKIISCHYGILWKDVQAFPALKKPTPDIHFRWYWNPVANDRNIESLPWLMHER